jgi:hypothetical protein
LTVPKYNIEPEGEKKATKAIPQKGIDFMALFIFRQGFFHLVGIPIVGAAGQAGLLLRFAYQVLSTWVCAKRRGSVPGAGAKTCAPEFVARPAKQSNISTPEGGVIMID